MTLASLTFLTLLSLAPVMGRWSALNRDGTWQQEVGGGGEWEKERGKGGEWEEERGGRGGLEEERGGRKNSWWSELYQETILHDSDEGDGEEYGGVRGLTTKAVMLEVARHVLRLLHQHRQQERRMGRQVMTSGIARDTVRLIVMGLMGYNGEEDCVNRVACEAGGIIARFYPSASLILGAADMMAPPQFSTITRLAKEAAMGRSCVTFRCGEAYYPSDNEVKP